MKKIFLLTSIIVGQCCGMDKKLQETIVEDIITRNTIENWDSYSNGLKIITLRQINELVTQQYSTESFEKKIKALKKNFADVPHQTHDLEKVDARPHVLPSIKIPEIPTPAQSTPLHNKQREISEQITGSWYWNASPKNS